MTLDRSRRTSLTLFAAHNLWLLTIGLRGCYYPQWSERANAIDLGFLTVWLLLFLCSLLPWFLCDVSWDKKCFLVAGYFTLYLIISFAVASVVTNSYMAGALGG